MHDGLWGVPTVEITLPNENLQNFYCQTFHILQDDFEDSRVNMVINRWFGIGVIE